MYHQLTKPDIDVPISNVEGLLEQVPDGIDLVRCVHHIEVIVTGAQPGEVQIARTKVDIVSTYSKP